MIRANRSSMVKGGASGVGVLCVGLLGALLSGGGCGSSVNGSLTGTAGASGHADGGKDSSAGGGHADGGKDSSAAGGHADGGKDSGAAGGDAAAGADGAAGPDGAVVDGAFDGAFDGAPDGAAGAVTFGAGLAVVDSDFMSTSISIVSATGTLVKDDCINSGTQAAGKLSLTLSGDVVLPAQPQLGGDLWLVDRGNTALTIVTPPTCAVSGQISVGTGFESNPHDVAVVSATKVYVTRYNTNVAPANANATGDDVLILDRATGAVTGRIGLTIYAAPVATFTIEARPDRMVIAGGKVYVTLGSQDAKFKAAGEGRVIVIDPATDLVTGTIALTGLKGCSAIQSVPAQSSLFVSCGGSFADADQSAASGVAQIDLSATPPTVLVTKASALGGQPVNFSWVGVLSATQGFAATLGTFPFGTTAGTNDALYMFNPTTGTATPVSLSAGAYDLGGAVVGAALLVVPDATTTKPLIHVFDVPATGAPTERTPFAPDPSKGLPPVQIAWY
jgi:hypothetical protein